MNTEEIYKLYGDLPLKFHHCDEYAFMFQRLVEPGIILRLYMGGDGEKIFRNIISKQLNITLNERKHYYAVLQQGDKTLWDENVIEE